MSNTRRAFANEKDARAAGAYYAALCGQPWALKRNEYPIVKAVAEGVNSSGGFWCQPNFRGRLLSFATSGARIARDAVAQRR
jgi:hypothetical protein